jgi:hypothetical protein
MKGRVGVSAYRRVCVWAWALDVFRDGQGSVHGSPVSTPNNELPLVQPYADTPTRRYGPHHALSLLRVLCGAVVKFLR